MAAVAAVEVLHRVAQAARAAAVQAKMEQRLQQPEQPIRAAAAARVVSITRRQGVRALLLSAIQRPDHFGPNRLLSVLARPGSGAAPGAMPKPPAA